MAETFFLRYDYLPYTAWLLAKGMEEAHECSKLLNLSMLFPPIGMFRQSDKDFLSVMSAAQFTILVVTWGSVAAQYYVSDLSIV